MLTRRDFLKLLGTLGSAAAFAPLQTNTPQYRRVVLFETRMAGFQFHDAEITAFNPLSAPWERLRLRVFQSIPVSSF
ncbi:MAG: twin-arginine translocation signal domain-containing protein [Anaerolineales bacterium]